MVPVDGIFSSLVNTSITTAVSSSVVSASSTASKTVNVAQFITLIHELFSCVIKTQYWVLSKPVTSAIFNVAELKFV